MEKPIIFKEGEYKIVDIDILKQKVKVWDIKDLYLKQSAEWFEITHAFLKNSSDFTSQQDVFLKERSANNIEKGNWVYFPWSGILLHTVTESEVYELRTNRNKNLITKEEQTVLKNFPVAVAGMSVGSNVTLSLAYQGIADTMKLADFDTLETTNLNRIRASLYDIGLPKIVITSRKIYEVNPYANLVAYEKGIDKTNLKDFICGEPKPKAIFELIDDFEMKIRIRLEAKKARIPVIMLTHLGDNLLLDVERYDLDPELELFNGLLGSIPDEILSKPIEEEEKNKYAVKLVGKENIPVKALESLKEINKSLVGRPQLAGTITAAAGLGSMLVRKIALKESIHSGRKLIKLGDYI